MSRATIKFPDAHACRVARAVQQVEGVEQVILFGSRARGDYGVDSDIDLLVVHAPDPDITAACRHAAERSMRDEYDDCVGVDIVPLAPDHFDFMQHGVNHVAAHAARDGITPMGHRYHPPSPPSEPGPSERHRREAMERTWHARSHLTALRGQFQLGPDFYDDPMEWDIRVGDHAQGALEHALKAVIAACGRRYDRTHELLDLLQAAQACVPGLTLRAHLKTLSAFAGGDIYGSPELDQDADHLWQDVQHDVSQLLQLCGQKAGYDPWTFTKADFQRGA